MYDLLIRKAFDRLPSGPVRQIDRQGL